MTVLLGDCIEIMSTLENGSVDAIVTDPPYELGFMGKGWDSSGIAYDGQVWIQALRILKPGGHLLSFGGTRTYHRMACAVEDAGFEIRDCLAWLYGSGFPKSLNVSKAIDKRRNDGDEARAVGLWLRTQRVAAGMHQKEVAAYWPSATGGLTGCVANWELGFNVPKWDQWLQLKEIIGFGDETDAEVWRLNGRKGTPGEAWNQREVIGERAGTFPARPAFAGETFGTVEARVALDITASATPEAVEWEGWGTALKPSLEPIVLARKPLVGSVTENVLKYGTGALNIDGCRIGDRWPANTLFDDESAQMLDQQSNASRFFYCSKVSKKERGTNDHPTVKPLDLMKWLVRLVTPPGGTVLDPFAGSGSTLVAAIAEGFSAIGIERDNHYFELAQRRLSEISCFQT